MALVPICHTPNLDAFGPRVMTSLTFLLHVFFKASNWLKFSFLSIFNNSYLNNFILYPCINNNILLKFLSFSQQKVKGQGQGQPKRPNHIFGHNFGSN